ncbi:DUF1566 domain-containing protein [Desulfocurvibacter africanus]|nr:DUF1566 domain-containing protein [Desulfocurvibacter africanus]
MKKTTMKIISMSAVLAAALLSGAAIVLATGSGGNLPVTGQTTEYIEGDDGTYQAGTDFPSIRFCDNNDGTMTDNMTGLMWVKNANAIGTLHQSFDTFGIVDWVNLIFCTAGDGAVTWQEALTFVAGLNNGTYKCGVTPDYSDWRLPTINELETLINYQIRPQTWLTSQGFSNIPTINSSRYWSSTTFAPNTSWVLMADFSNQACVTLTSKDYCMVNVWPVRGPLQD